MKAVNKLAIVFSLGALLPFAASAKTLEESYIEHCRKGADVPVPVAVVTPSVSGDYIGTTVELEFVVDTTGKPIDLIVKSTPDSAVAEAVADAVKQWRFTPAKLNGAAVATKVLLPVKIVEPSPAGNGFAVN